MAELTQRLQRNQSNGILSRIGEIKRLRPSLAKCLFTLSVQGRKARHNDRKRSEREQLGLSNAAPWFDAAVVAPLLYPEAAPHCRHLDDWLAHFGLAVYARHGALADAFATAELWLVLLQAAQRENIATAHQLRGLLRARRWLPAN